MSLAQQVSNVHGGRYFYLLLYSCDIIVNSLPLQVFLLVQFFVTDQSIKDALHYFTLLDPSYA